MAGALLLLLRERRRKRAAGSEAREGKNADEAHRGSALCGSLGGPLVTKGGDRASRCAAARALPPAPRGLRTFTDFLVLKLTI